MTHTAVPSHCSVAFKEWASVCAALYAGRQSIILRKGGIHEPPEFRPEPTAFWLYPTCLHQRAEDLLIDVVEAPPAGDVVQINALAIVHKAARLSDLNAARSLAPFHIWTEGLINRRFHYKVPGLWVLIVRVYTMARPYVIRDEPEYAGCRTWVRLQSPLSTAGAEPVVPDSDFDQVCLAIDERIQVAAGFVIDGAAAP